MSNCYVCTKVIYDQEAYVVFGLQKVHLSCYDKMTKCLTCDKKCYDDVKSKCMMCEFVNVEPINSNDPNDNKKRKTGTTKSNKCDKCGSETYYKKYLTTVGKGGTFAYDAETCPKCGFVNQLDAQFLGDE